MKPGPTMRSKVLAVVSVKMMVFWNMSLCGLVGKYQRFAAPILYPEDGGRLLKNVGTYLPDYTAPLTSQRIFLASCS
jgi:hypothetical protein